jgi:hypothetical protein
MAPHYAFVFEPASREVVGKKLVETIPAVTDPGVLAQLSQDEQVEAARLAARHANAALPVPPIHLRAVRKREAGGTLAA